MSALALDREPVDEADPASPPGEAYAPLIAQIERRGPAAVAAAVTARAAADGVGFGSGAQHKAFALDPVPRLVGASEWTRVAAALEQRARALGALVEDAYGDRRAVAAGVLPQRVLDSCDYLEPDMAGVPVGLAGFISGLDLVRGADGALRVLEDNTRTPSGAAYAIAAREAVAAALDDGPPPAVADPRGWTSLLRDTLRAAAPAGGDGDPYVVLLSDGPVNSAWYEHAVLGRAIGADVVTPSELFVRGGRLHARAGARRARPVDVVYRRTDEDRLRDRGGRATWLADLLLEPLRRETVAVVNPLGAGIADDKLMHAYVEELTRFYLGEEPAIASVTTYDLGDPDVLAEVEPRLGELVVKPRTGHGGTGIVVGPRAERGDVEAVRARIRAEPAGFVAQEMEMLSTHPTVIGDRLEPRHVDLRPFVAGAGAGARTGPVALTRVALGAGALVVNSSQDGGGKDTWLFAR